MIATADPAALVPAGSGTDAIAPATNRLLALLPPNELAAAGCRRWPSPGSPDS
ncbi:hypothetical protein ACH4Y0_01935 [Streptomyces sp. NPDC020707]|uniref:hypothetical protein n=1 Tax=Streptomyces sp. NPDC020707 TaxID=3365084 RepID=UPI0037A91C40